MTPTESYAHKVVDGDIVACKWIKLAAQRFLSDLKRKDLIFDELDADRVVNYFQKYLTHWEDRWAGLPIMLEEWQCFIVQQLFGWKYKSTGKRRFRKAYVQVARKNAKTTLAGGIADYELTASHTNSPQVYVGANNEKQAKICTNTAARIMEHSKMRHYITSGHLKFYAYNDIIHTVTFKKKNGVMNAMSRDAKTKDGFNPSLGIIDEYHEAKDDKLLNVIQSGQGSREEPLLMVITTAGFNKAGPCYSKIRKYSTDVLEGKIEDDSFFAVIYELDEGDDWTNPDNWIKANPNLNVSVTLEFLKARCKEAMNEGGTTEIDFRTKNLNEWCDAAKVWIPDHIWIKNTHGIKISDLIGKTCYGGLDCAKSVDLNAFCLIFPDYFEVNGKLVTPLLPFFWIPEAKVTSNSDRVDYKRWQQQGFINVTGGNIVDYTFIERDIIKAIEPYDFRGVDYDAAYAGNVASNLASHGYECTPLGQGFLSLTLPTNELERMAVGELFEHFNNPVMRWMIGNVVLDTDAAGNIKPNKAKSQNKIDGVSALVNAIARWKRTGAQMQTAEIIFI